MDTERFVIQYFIGPNFISGICNYKQGLALIVWAISATPSLSHLYVLLPQALTIQDCCNNILNLMAKCSHLKGSGIFLRS